MRSKIMGSANAFSWGAASAGTPEFDGGPIERSKSLFVAWITRRRTRREQDVRGHALLSCSEPSEVRLWALYGRPCEQTVETSGATGAKGAASAR